MNHDDIRVLGDAVATYAEITGDEIIVTLSDGRRISNPLAWHWWLEEARPEQRANFEVYSDSIWWPNLSEGLDVEGMLRGIKSRRPRGY